VAIIEFLHGSYEAFGVEAPPTLPFLMFGLCALQRPSIGELATCCGMPLKTASRGVKELRSRGWITIEGDRKDERKRRVKLTVAGANILRLVNGALVDTSFRIVENTVGKPPFSLQQTAPLKRP
jgi:DNA-binding MarR family transcriptional regulator